VSGRDQENIRDVEQLSGMFRDDDPSVVRALVAAGWFPHRRIDITSSVDFLEGAGFQLNGTALRVWEEFGELVIKSSADRVPASSLRVDPVDACIDALDEAVLLSRRLGQNYSPLGMWSVQFRSYIAADGKVIAVGTHTIWELGSSFTEAVTYVVTGGEDRVHRADWLP
jgi:hypothetical protein